MNKFTHVCLQLALLATVAAFASCGSSKHTIGIEEGWDLLSDKKVNFVNDRDNILISNRTLYTALRFKVQGHDIHVHEVKIFFDNGDKLEPNIGYDLRAGESSKEIQLGGEGRYIDHIEFRYRTMGSLLKGRAVLLVLAKRYYRPY